MKKIVNGRVYDTETATLIGEWWNNESGLRRIDEVLYRKKTGEYFLHGFGGAATQYAAAISQNSWQSGERIMPQSYGEAQAWAEEHLAADCYAAEFGPVSEDDTRTTVTISLPASTIERAKRAAAQKGASLSGYIEDLIAAAR